LAHASAEFMRIIVGACLVDPDHLKQCLDSFSRLRPADVRLMDFDSLGDLVADLEDRVQRVHRALEDDGNPFPTDLSDLRVTHLH